MKADKKRRTLRIVSIAIVALFIIIVIAGIVRDVYRDWQKPTQAQADSALGAAQAALPDGNYTFSTRGGIRDNALIVTAANGSERHTFVVSVENGTVLLHVEADGADAARYCKRVDACHLVRMHG